MFRYIAISWNDADTRAAAFARSIELKIRQDSAWQYASLTAGLIVLCADVRPGQSEIYLVPPNSGVVLGKLFPRQARSDASAVTFSEHECIELIRTRGRLLMDRYWGRYVAFLRDSVDRSTWVARDPTGALPCWHFIRQGVHFFCSWLEECAALGLVHFDLNREYLAAYASYPSLLQSTTTAIKGVLEVQAGSCWEIDCHLAIKKREYWDPARIAREDVIRDLPIAVRDVRAEIKRCIESWASCYTGILHLLSGGLDSSVVLSCLKSKKTTTAVTCLTYYNASSASADERPLARLIADATRTPLIEIEERVDDGEFGRLFHLPRSANPWLMQYYLTHSKSENAVARSCAADAIFYGVGGDQIFFQGPLRLAAIDYTQTHWNPFSQLQTVGEFARAEGLSAWSIMVDALRMKWLRQKWNPLAIMERDMLLVTRAALDAARTSSLLIHPWLTNAAGISWGKREHIRMMSLSHDFYDPLASTDAAERVRPLIAQPLMELCLRIPTYVLGAGGFDRIAVRRAFEAELPQEIVWRRAKGIIDSYYHGLLDHNATIARELLLDGVLVREGILDRSKLEKLLSKARLGVAREVAEVVVYHLGTEGWLRSWQNARIRAAA